MPAARRRMLSPCRSAIRAAAVPAKATGSARPLRALTRPAPAVALRAAAMDATDTIRVVASVVRPPATAHADAVPEMGSSAPNAVATLLPPRYCANAGQEWPTMAPMPAAACPAGDAPSARAA